MPQFSSWNPRNDQYWLFSAAANGSSEIIAPSTASLCGVPENSRSRASRMLFAITSGCRRNPSTNIITYNPSLSKSAFGFGRGRLAETVQSKEN